MNGYITEKGPINPQIQQNMEQNPQPGFAQNQVYTYGKQQYVEQQYGSPVIISSSLPQGGNAIIINQPIPSLVITTTPKMSGTSPVPMICPYCQQQITTSVEKSCNCVTCFLCWVTGFCFFCCYQICAGKEVGCCDAVHRCPSCHALIGQYISF